MNFISDIFKGSLRKACESKFNFLEKEGFMKSFDFYGTESTLTYEKNDIKVTLMWETREGNPWFLIKTREREFGLENLESEIRDRYSFIKPGQQNFLDWTWNSMNRKEYLELIEKKIKNVLQHQ